MEAAADQQVGGKPGHSPFHRGQSLSGMGPSVKGMGWGDSEEAAGKRGQPAGKGKRC